MRKRIYIWVILGINLLVLTSQAVAQQEQWLQYHSEREVNLIGDGMNLQELKLSTEKPSGVELPQFKGENQFFAKWSTPMVKSGHLWIALDRTDKRGLYDSLYIDSNGNGHLKDEIPVASYRADQDYTYFGPVKVMFEVEDGPVTYHLNFRFRNRSEKDRELYVYSGGWYEGSITVGGVKKHCVLIDQNANGAFDDKSLNASESDRIRIGKQSGQDTRFVGNYIEVDGSLATAYSVSAIPADPALNRPTHHGGFNYSGAEGKYFCGSLPLPEKYKVLANDQSRQRRSISVLGPLVVLLVPLSVGVADFSRTSEKTAREEALSKQERVFGLVTVYRGAKQHFAWFEQVPTLDWDKAFIEYLPLVEEDQGLYDYYRLLQSFVALLEDGHTDIRLPSKIQRELDALPLKLDLVEEQWVVIQRYPVQEILDEDVPVGTVVLSIEGESPLRYFQQRLFPYISGGDAAYSAAFL